MRGGSRAEAMAMPPPAVAVEVSVGEPPPWVAHSTSKASCAMPGSPSRARRRCSAATVATTSAAEEPVPDADGTPPSVWMRMGSTRFQTRSTAVTR
jgi:hypothetical protein